MKKQYHQPTTEFQVIHTGVLCGSGGFSDISEDTGTSLGGGI